MKRTWTAAGLLMMALWAGTASAELAPPAAPDDHIRTAFEMGGVPVAVDADVYGAHVERVQAYEVTALNLGAQPEAAFDLSLWFGERPVAGRATRWQADDVVFWPEGEALANSVTQDSASFSPWGVAFRRSTARRLDAESAWYPAEKKCLWDVWKADVQLDALDGFAVSDALAELDPILDALGVTAGTQPVNGAALTLEELRAATQAHLAFGAAPDEAVIRDWTREDEHYELYLPQLYHGLMILPTQQYMTGIYGLETPHATVDAKISRRGIESLNLGFVPGEEEASGDPFAPITVQEALAACGRLESCEESRAWVNPHVSRIDLGYVMLTQDRAVTKAKARPAWIMNVVYTHETDAEQGERACVIAVDAQTGEMLLDCL